jgi:hypothetical protein
MSDDGWRTSVRWVVAHPTEAKVLLAGRDGAVRRRGRPGRLPRGARALLAAAPAAPAAGASWLPPDLERLRDFSLPPRPA